MALEARVLPCPKCGGSVQEGARRCAYCDAHVATLRCSACFHMNVAEALHCSGCGRDLGLEPIGKTDRVQCPDCDEPMDAFDEEPGVLRDCGKCGGQFVDHALLRAMLERCTVYADASPRPRPAVPITTRVRYVACPVCRTLMMRKNFGGSSGVIVDICTKHGTWFDLGELPRVLAFAENGGLVRAKKREEEATTRARSEARAHAIVEAGRDAHVSTHAGSHAMTDYDAADAVADFVGFLGVLLR